MLESGLEKCNCKKTKCVRHGNCKECIDYHSQSKRYPVPYCKRPGKRSLEFIEKTMEMRSIKRKEIVDYFIEINGVDNGQGRIAGKGWEVEVGPEKPVTLGKFTISSVIVVLRCQKELFDKMYSDFFMKFFRAGG